MRKAVVARRQAGEHAASGVVAASPSAWSIASYLGGGRSHHATFSHLCTADQPGRPAGACFVPPLELPPSIVRFMTATLRSVSLPVVDPDSIESAERADDVPYHVFLWNDPVTLMDVVVRVLKKIFGYGTEKAELLMLTAHREGKVIVWTGARDRARQFCLELGSHGLQATVARAS